MKIIFLCGELDPGRDSVGEYVRCLSEELIHQGHHVAIASINDTYIELMQNSGLLGPAELSVLRLPSNLAEEDRVALARVFIDSFNPDWISLQFVPSAFHHNGLAFGLAGKLLTAGNGRKWEVMFHELWKGISAKAGKMEKLFGRFQFALIRSMIKKLDPKVVHTHNDVYQKELERTGTAAKLLPRFFRTDLSAKPNYTEVAKQFVLDLPDEPNLNAE